MNDTEKRKKIMALIEELAHEWNTLIQAFGNECAYTDSIADKIHHKIEELLTI